MKISKLHFLHKMLPNNSQSKKPVKTVKSQKFQKSSQNSAFKKKVLSGEEILINKCKSILNLNHKSASEIKRNLNFNLSEDNSYVLVHYKQDNPQEPWSNIRGKILKLSPNGEFYDRCVSDTNGVTREISLDNLSINDNDFVLKCKDNSNVMREINFSKGSLRPSFQGSFVRIWKDAGTVYFSSQRKIDASNSKWNSTRSLQDLFTTLTCTEPEKYFDEKKANSPYCHRFLIVSPSSQTCSSINSGAGFVLYCDTIKCYTPTQADTDTEWYCKLSEIPAIPNDFPPENIAIKLKNRISINSEDMAVFVEEGFVPSITEVRRFFHYVQRNKKVKSNEQNSSDSFTNSERVNDLNKDPYFQKSFNLDQANDWLENRQEPIYFTQYDETERRTVSYRITPASFSNKELLTKRETGSTPIKEIMNVRNYALKYDENFKILAKRTLIKNKYMAINEKYVNSSKIDHSLYDSEMENKILMEIKASLEESRAKYSKLSIEDPERRDDYIKLYHQESEKFNRVIEEFDAKRAKYLKSLDKLVTEKVPKEMYESIDSSEIKGDDLKTINKRWRILAMAQWLSYGGYYRSITSGEFYNAKELLDKTVNVLTSAYATNFKEMFNKAPWSASQEVTLRGNGKAVKAKEELLELVKGLDKRDFKEALQKLESARLYRLMSMVQNM